MWFMPGHCVNQRWGWQASSIIRKLSKAPDCAHRYARHVVEFPTEPRNGRSAACDEQGCSLMLLQLHRGPLATCQTMCQADGEETGASLLRREQ